MKGLTQRRMHVAAGEILRGAALLHLVLMSEGAEKDEARHDLAFWAQSQPADVVKDAVTVMTAAHDRALASILNTPLDVIQTVRLEEQEARA